MIYLSRKIVEGPWGGGNKSVEAIALELKKRNIPYTFTLNEKVTIILCFDPRPNSDNVWYQDFLDHKARYGSKIIQRVGDVGTHSKPELTSLLEKIVEIKSTDHFIFPSEWSKNFLSKKIENASIIKNMPKTIFYSKRKGFSEKSLKSSIKVVTHHWSTNTKKGFDIYESIGKYTVKNNDIEMTYIGRTPEGFSAGNINVLNPMTDEELSMELPKHDIYFTASTEEAGANHVLEALAAGLPIVYSPHGGSIPEYCDGFGIPFNDNPIQTIKECYQKSADLTRNVLHYNDTILDMAKMYVDILEEQISRSAS